MVADPSDFAQRLALALGGAADVRPATAAMKALAKALGTSYQSIAKLYGGQSKTLTAENCVRAARHLGVDVEWLATGEGSMRSTRVWPFGDQISPESFALLTADEVQPAIDVLLGALARKASQRAVSGERSPDRVEDNLPRNAA